MTITSLDELINGMIGYPTDVQKDAVTAEAAGIWHSTWLASGTPGAGSAPGASLNGAVYSGTVNGQIPIPAAVSGAQTYLARADFAQAANCGCVALDDWLWANGAIVATTVGAQAITSPAWPARDVAGSTNGVGVYAAMFVSGATGNGGAITNTTMSYTNSAGTAGRTATLSSFPATAAAGTFVPFSLQAGDIGIRSVQSITLGTSYVSGTVHLVAYRAIARIPTPTANIGNDRDFAGLGLPKIWDSSVLTMRYLPTGTAVGIVSGSLTYAQG
ncbi:MAG: hypothetical protein HOQ03_05605 [Thermoleophilia bacterium]|nr:hypothetical protein [Thermoleophilia bacterium]